MARIFGKNVAEAFQVGLIHHWRGCAPLLKSQRSDVGKYSSIGSCYKMGLVGISLEAKERPGWAESLSSEQATRAVEYGTLEINGFPSWMVDLAVAKPVETQSVLLKEIRVEYSNQELYHFGLLQDILHADERIAALIAPELLADLERMPDVPRPLLSQLLQSIVRGIDSEAVPRFVRIGLDRFDGMPGGAAALYLAAVFSLDAPTAITALNSKLDGLAQDQQTALVDEFLSLTFGHMAHSSRFDINSSTPETLHQLVLIDYETRSRETARLRPFRGGYTPNAYDNAQEARSAVFSQFLKASGAATFNAILGLKDNEHCSILAPRLQEWANEVALRDSEIAPWPADEVVRFEQSCEVAPRTGRELQSLGRARLEDLQHEWVHGDFQQGTTLKKLDSEEEVQRFIAAELHNRAGKAYSVVREVHVADEKEPDIRLQAKAGNARLAIEIKVVGARWTLKDLEIALRDQLCGRYLRAVDGRYGILLLVLQKKRAEGWVDTVTKQSLSFGDVVTRLSEQAARLGGESHDSPQPIVCVIDVSTCR